MRALLLGLLLLPYPVLAENLTLRSQAREAVVYRDGARVTHRVRVTLPAGAHQITLPDLPPDLPVDFLRVSAPELKLGAIRYRGDLVPPRDAAADAAIQATEARINTLKARIAEVETTAARQRLAVGAAEARIAFLAALGASDTLPANPDALRAMGAMIAEDTLAAREAAFDAERAAQQSLEGLPDLTSALASAEKALAALVPERDERPLLVLNVAATEAVSEAILDVSFPVEAYWTPTYDLRLSDAARPKLRIERGAQVVQNSGENWTGIALRVYTQATSNRMEPWPLAPDLRQIFDETAVIQDRAVAAPMREMTRQMAEDGAFAMRGEAQGLSVTYTFSQPVDVASGVDEVRLPFDQVELDATLVARAVPLLGDRAFLLARVTNTTDAPLLPSGDVLRYFDGGFVGTGDLPAIEPGQEAEIGFGQIEGLQLTRRVLDRETGDRGVISRSNELTEEVELTLQNLTDRSWRVELRDRVPISEQEDLEIAYTATPPPNVEAVDGKRGVLEWTFDMAPGSRRSVELNQRITWPEGQVLR